MFVKLSLFSTDAPILGFVQYKSQMFFMARSFNQDISRWNVGNVKEMNKMFFHASSFNQTLCKWKRATRKCDRIFYESGCPMSNNDICFTTVGQKAPESACQKCDGD